MKYDFCLGLSKFVKYVVIFALPVIVDGFIFQFPEIAQLTVGGLLVMFINWIKIKYDVKFL